METYSPLMPIQRGACPSDIKIELTVLIPCRNEEGSIARCVTDACEFLARNAIEGEVVVVDNGSRDQSAALAAAAGARIVQEQKAGYGNAINAGIRAARGRFIILGDGDGEHDLSALEPFWTQLQGAGDFIIGNRFAGGIDPQAMPNLRRYVGNPLLTGIGKLFFPAPVSDFHCGLRGFNTAAVRALNLQSPGMEWASEMIVKAVLQNRCIVEVPVAQRRALDPNRGSRLRVWRDGWRHLRLLLLLSPRWTFAYPGWFLLATGLLVMALPLLAPPTPQGLGFGTYTMLFGAAGILCGTQLLGLALVARVFQETAGIVRGTWAAQVQHRHLLEKSLLCGAGLILAGGAGSVGSFVLWARDIVSETRLFLVIPSLTALIFGMQIIFIGFLSALIALQNPWRRGC